MRFLFYLVFEIAFILQAISQESTLKNSARLLPDSTIVDTLSSKRDTASTAGVDTMVAYSSSDSIVYSLETKMMSMYNDGNIKYQTMELQSARIDINWNTSTMTAFGVADTSDTSHSKMRGTPVMKDGGEVYDGKELGYNFKTKRGRITLADTKLDEAFYHGEQLKKLGKDVMFVEDGRYTTCDKADPDYYFYSPKMKITVQDKVIAEPIYMYIADVPVFWFPVAVFPNKGGRRSGIIAPAITEDATHGRLLRHIGYYWAISDYMDLSLKTDLYTKGSWAISSNYQYNLRYNFSGALSGEYRKMLEGEQSDLNSRKNISYNLHVGHRQEIDPTTRFDVNFYFTSNNAYRNTIDINQALNQDITSNATLSKSWEGTPNSMSVNISRRQNLTNGNISETLPSLNFNHSQSYPFRSSKKKSASFNDLSWYDMIGFSYSSNFSNNRAKTQQLISGIHANIAGIETTTSVNGYRLDRNYRLSQRVSMSIAPKLGYFTISPSMNYQDERSYSNNDVPDTTAGSLYFRKDRQWYRNGTFSSGVLTSTKIYGIVQPEMFGVAAFRHTVTPSLSFVYSKQLVGDNLPPKQMVMSLNVGNLFEMKTTPAENDKEGSKIQLMNVNAGVSYNFSADSLNFSPINLNYRTNIGNLLDIGGGAGFDLYKLQQVGPNQYNKINKFLLTEEGRLARMTNFSLSLSTSLSGERRKSPGEGSSSDTLQRKKIKSGFIGLNEDEEPDFSIPWHLSLDWAYSEYKVLPARSHSSNLRATLDFNLTNNWKFTMNSGYDITNKQVVFPQISISRDLHCWIMEFNWVPFGAYRYYQFEIRLKAPQLQDIKLTKTGSSSGIY